MAGGKQDESEKLAEMRSRIGQVRHILSQMSNTEKDLHTLESAHREARELSRRTAEKLVNTEARASLIVHPPETVEDKQDLARRINTLCLESSRGILHPDSGAVCSLVVISDAYGGKFALEEKLTRKRSKTTRDLAALLPFRLAPDIADVGEIEGLGGRSRPTHSEPRPNEPAPDHQGQAAGALQTPVTDLEISVMARNKLKRHGIRTVYDLTRTPRSEIEAMFRPGGQSMADIEAALKARGVDFAKQ